MKDADVREDGIWWAGNLRVRIEHDLRKPIAKGRNVNLLGKKNWVPLQYEKLPQVCYKCGELVR